MSGGGGWNRKRRGQEIGEERGRGEDGKERRRVGRTKEREGRKSEGRELRLHTVCSQEQSLFAFVCVLPIVRLQSLVPNHNLVIASYDIIRNDVDFFRYIRT